MWVMARACCRFGGGQPAARGAEHAPTPPPAARSRLRPPHSGSRLPQSKAPHSGSRLPQSTAPHRGSGLPQSAADLGHALRLSSVPRLHQQVCGSPGKERGVIWNSPAILFFPFICRPSFGPHVNHTRCGIGSARKRRDFFDPGILRWRAERSESIAEISATPSETSKAASRSSEVHRDSSECLA